MHVSSFYIDKYLNDKSKHCCLRDRIINTEYNVQMVAYHAVPLDEMKMCNTSNVTMNTDGVKDHKICHYKSLDHILSYRSICSRLCTHFNQIYRYTHTSKSYDTQV